MATHGGKPDAIVDNLLDVDMTGAFTELPDGVRVVEFEEEAEIGSVWEGTMEETRAVLASLILKPAEVRPSQCPRHDANCFQYPKPCGLCKQSDTMYSCAYHYNRHM
jgi:hypothetical protein